MRQSIQSKGPENCLMGLTSSNHWALIGQYRSRDLNTGLWLVNTDHVTSRNHWTLHWPPSSPASYCIFLSVLNSYITQHNVSHSWPRHVLIGLQLTNQNSGFKVLSNQSSQGLFLINRSGDPYILVLHAKGSGYLPGISPHPKYTTQMWETFISTNRSKCWVSGFLKEGIAGDLI